MSDPNALAAQLQAAQAHHGMGRFADAAALYETIIRRNPAFAPAWFGRGSALQALRDFSGALQNYDRAIALKPDFAPAHNNRGAVLKELGRAEAALESCERAIALKGDFANAHNNRGMILLGLDRAGEALPAHDRAIALKPDFAKAHNNRGMALRQLGRLEEALQSYDRALALAPADALTRLNKALCLMLLQRFDEAWPLYEARHQLTPMARMPEGIPRWNGAQDLKDKTLLIHAEQGLGDTIQFCRYALAATARGARVILMVQDALVALLRDLGPGIAVMGLSAPLPEADFHCPLLSLSAAFGTTRQTIPAYAAYLRPEPARVAAWAAKIGQGGLKLGIGWQGAVSRIDAGRSFALRQFAPLAAIPGVRLVSLQKNAGIEQLQAPGPALPVETLGVDFDAGPDAFLDTAAVMQSMDLIVTSDTAIAHLAGALGRPAWVALKAFPDWRWQLEGTDSPWYPSLRLFRQAAPGDWPGVFAAMAAALRDEAISS